MIRRLTILTAVYFAAATSAFAQGGLTNPRGALANFDFENIQPFLSEVGIGWSEQTASDGTPYLSAAFGSDLNFNFIPSACLGADGKSGCVGAQIVALYTGVDPAVDRLVAFNQQYAFTTAGKLSDGTIYLSRYEIADYGIPRGNMLSSLGSFRSLGLMFWSDLAGITSVSADAEESATALDAVASVITGMAEKIRTQTVEAVAPGPDFVYESNHHQLAIERTEEMVQLIAASAGDTPNKIDNRPQ